MFYQTEIKIPALKFSLSAIVTVEQFCFHWIKILAAENKKAGGKEIQIVHTH